MCLILEEVENIFGNRGVESGRGGGRELTLATRSIAYCLGSMSHKIRLMLAFQATTCCLDAHSFLRVDSLDMRWYMTRPRTPATVMT